MNKKMLTKTIIIMLIFFVIILFYSNVTFAKINTDVSIGNKLIKEPEEIGNKITGAIQAIGVFVSVGITMYIGIKYMMCSVEEKAEYKKTATAYIVGAILIYGSTGLVKYIYDFFN